MSVKILKKNGRTIENFNPSKIHNAVRKASVRANLYLSDNELLFISNNVLEEIKSKHIDIAPVDMVHDLVIAYTEVLSPEISKCYADYRGYKQSFNKTFEKVMSDTTKLLANGDKENANKNSTLISTRKELTSGIVSKHIALDYELPESVARAHKEGYIHSHDSTDEIFGSINCCLFDMENVLKDGYTINGVSMNEPKHLESAMDVISDIILSASSQQFGGFTVPEIDHVIGKYAEMGYNEYLEKFEHMSCAFKSREDYEKWVEDFTYNILVHACENKYDHRLNTINNSNGQTSFTTFTIGIDTSKWGRLSCKAILEARLKGLGSKHITAIFPKLVFLHREEINGAPNSPNHDLKQLAIQCSMKNMYPDWLSLDAGYLGDIFDKHKQAISPMGCRAFLSPWYKRGGAKPADENDEIVFKGRANCGAVSLNLPRYALDSDHDFNKFMELVDKYFDICIEKHLYKYNKLKDTLAGTNPLFFCEGGCHMKLKPTETIEKAIRTFTWSIGYIGLDEVCRYFTGEGINKQVNLAVEVLQHIADRIEEAKEKYGLLFALYSTPAESLCYRFLTMDREKYGIVKGVTDKEYYTNSFHVWVKEPIHALDKQDVEKKCFDIAKGGRIVYNEFPHTHNRKAIEQCINYAMSLGLYYGINLQLDTCLECGHSAEFERIDGVVKCPKCDSDHVLSTNRVCGYLGYSVIDHDTRFNKGKLAEKNDRVDHFNQRGDDCELCRH